MISPSEVSFVSPHSTQLWCVKVLPVLERSPWPCCIMVDGAAAEIQEGKSYMVRQEASGGGGANHLKYLSLETNLGFLDNNLNSFKDGASNDYH